MDEWTNGRVDEWINIFTRLASAVDRDDEVFIVGVTELRRELEVVASVALAVDSVPQISVPRDAVKLVLRLRDPVGERHDPRPVFVGLRRHGVARSVTNRDAEDFREEVDGRTPEQVRHEEELSLDRSFSGSVDAVLKLVGLVRRQRHERRHPVPVVRLKIDQAKLITKA